MRRSSGFLMRWVERLAGSEDGPEDIDTAAGEGDDCLMMAFSLAPFALIERAAEGVGERAEGGLVEHALEPIVGVAGALQVPAFAGLAQHRCEAGGAGQGGGGAETGDVACLGEELGGEDGPHSGQAADEGPIRVVLDEVGEAAVE